MAPCDNNPTCNNKKCPIKKNKKVKFSREPSGKKRVGVMENPDTVNKSKPVWYFNRCDKEGKWAFTEENVGGDFWLKVLPRLQAFETQTWNDILVVAKKHNHPIEIGQLNRCAQKRLDALRLEIEEITSLKIEGTIRIYGIREIDKFVILWYDDKHGDNDECVCKSSLKNT